MRICTSMSHLGNVSRCREGQMWFSLSLVSQTSVVYQLQRRVRTLREQLQRRDLHLDLLRRKLSLQEDSVRMKSLLQSERDEANIRFVSEIACGRLQQNFAQTLNLLFANTLNTFCKSHYLHHMWLVSLSLTSQRKYLIIAEFSIHKWRLRRLSIYILSSN